MICNLRCVVLNILSEKGGRVRIILFFVRPKPVFSGSGNWGNCGKKFITHCIICITHCVIYKTHCIIYKTHCVI